jgi:hypothetical protein
MSVLPIIGGAVFLAGVAIMVASRRERGAAAALFVLGAFLAMSGAASVARELRSGPYRTPVVVIWPIVTVGCVVLGVRAVKRAKP